MLSGMCRSNVGPEDVVVFEGIVFSRREVPRKRDFGNRDERPTMVPAFVGYNDQGEALVWSMDRHQPVEGRAYSVFALKRQLHRRGRKDREIPVIADPSLLGLEERTGDEGSLTVVTSLEEVTVNPLPDREGKKRDPYEIRVGFGPHGKRVMAKAGVDLPLREKTTFVVTPKGLDTLEAFAVAANGRTEAVDPLTVRVGVSLFSWPDQLGLSERELPRLTVTKLEAQADRRTKDMRDAYDRAVQDSRLIRGYPDRKEEAEILTKGFPRLVILNACADAARAWITERDERKAAAEEAAKAEAAAPQGDEAKLAGQVGELVDGLMPNGGEGEKPAKAPSKKKGGKKAKASSVQA